VIPLVYRVLLAASLVTVIIGLLVIIDYLAAGGGE